MNDVISANKPRKRQVMYLPPDQSLVETFTQLVWEHLGNEEERHDTEFIRGFSKFLNVVARIQAKRFSQGV